MVGFGFHFFVCLVLKMRTAVPDSTISGQDLEAFLFSRASLFFQLASLKQIFLEVLILGQK